MRKRAILVYVGGLDLPAVLHSRSKLPHRILSGHLEFEVHYLTMKDERLLLKLRNPSFGLHCLPSVFGALGG